MAPTQKASAADTKEANSCELEAFEGACAHGTPRYPIVDALALDRRFLTVKKNVSAELLSIRRGRGGHIRQTLSDEAVAKVLNDQLMQIKPESVEKIINTFAHIDRSAARLVFGISTGFANMDSLAALIEAGNFDKLGNRDPDARMYAARETSLADALSYLNNSKGIYRECLLTPSITFKGATFAILDEFLLRKIETDRSAVKELAESGSKLLLPVGLASGINPFNAVFPSEIQIRIKDILDGARELQSSSPGTIDLGTAVESYLVEPILERLRKAGIRADVGEALISKVELVRGDIPNDPAHFFSDDAIAERLNGSQGITPLEVKQILDQLPVGYRALAGELVAQTSMVFSPRSMTRALRAMHQDISRVLEKAGISPDNLYFFTQHSHKSSVLVTTAYCMANNISPDRVISSEEVMLVSDLPPKSALVVLDDLAGSGETLNDAIKTLMRHGFKETLFVAPLVASSHSLISSSLSATLAITPNIKPLPCVVIPELRKSKFYKSLDREHQVLVERVIGDVGHSANGLSVTFPYMSPDNCNALWDAKFAKHFTINGKGTQGKYLDPLGEDQPDPRELERRIAANLAKARSLHEPQSSLEAIYHGALAFQDTLLLERLARGFGVEAFLPPQVLKRELRSLIGGRQEQGLEELRDNVSSKALAVKDLERIHETIKVLREYFNSLPRKGAGALLKLVDCHLVFAKSALPLLRNTVKDALDALASSPTAPEVFIKTETSVASVMQIAEPLGLGGSLRRTLRASIIKKLPEIAPKIETEAKVLLRELISLPPENFRKENILQRQRVGAFCEVGKALERMVERAKVEPKNIPSITKVLDATHAVKEYVETKAQFLLLRPGYSLYGLHSHLENLSKAADRLTLASRKLGEDAAFDIKSCALNVQEHLVHHLSSSQRSLTAADSSVSALRTALNDLDLILGDLATLSSKVGNDLSAISEEVLALKAETYKKILALTTESFEKIKHAKDNLNSLSLKEIYQHCIEAQLLEHSTAGLDLKNSQVTHGEIAKTRRALLDSAFQIALLHAKDALVWNPLAVTNYSDELDCIREILLEAGVCSRVRPSGGHENTTPNEAEWVRHRCDKIRAYLDWKKDIAYTLSRLYITDDYDLNYHLQKVNDRGLSHLVNFTIAASNPPILEAVDIEKARQALLASVNSYVRDAVSQLRRNIAVARLQDLRIPLALSWLSDSKNISQSMGILDQDSMREFDLLKDIIRKRVEKEMSRLIAWGSLESPHPDDLKFNSTALYDIKGALSKFEQASKSLGFESDFQRYTTQLLDVLVDRARDSLKTNSSGFIFEALQGQVSQLGFLERYREQLAQLSEVAPNSASPDKHFSQENSFPIGTIDPASFLEHLQVSEILFSKLEPPKIIEKNMKKADEKK